MKCSSLFILAFTLLIPFGFGCDSNSNNGTGEPITMTQLTGVVFTAGEFCQESIDGFVAPDEVSVDIVLTNFVSGNVTITNMSTGDEAKCDMGESSRLVVPADFSCDSISSSNIGGLPVSDQLHISITLNEEENSVEITNQTDGRCVLLLLQSLNTN